MYQKDRIRLIVAFFIILAIGLSYWFGEDQDITGYIAAAGMLIWLGLIYFLRKPSDD